MRRSRTVALFFAAVCTADSLVANAVTESVATYTGANGVYSNPANWSTNPVVPINSGGNIYDVTIAGKTVAYNLSGSGQLNTLLMSSSTLNLNTGCNLSVTNGGAITVSHINATASTFTDTESVSNLTSTSLSAASGGSVDFTGLTTFATNEQFVGDVQRNRRAVQDSAACAVRHF